MLDDLRARAEDTVALAQAKGAKDARATAYRGRSVSYSVRDGKLEEVQDTTTMSVSFDLYVDGRYSSHATSDLSPARFDAFVAEAVALTRALEIDRHRAIPDPALYANRATVDLDLVDPTVASLSHQDRLGPCMEMDAIARSDARVISATSYFSDSHDASATVTSNGFSGSKESTDAWIGAEVTVRDAGDARPEGHWGVGGHHRAAAQPAEQTARNALEDAIARIGSTKGPTKKGLLIIHPRNAARIVRQLLGPASGQAIQQKRSFWSGKDDRKIFSDTFTLTDDPLLVRGLASKLFDDEGMSAKARKVVDKGVVRDLFFDTYYARKLGRAPTTASPSNLTFALGGRDLAAILADADDAIFLTSWLGGNADPTSGDFSLGLRGHLVKNGNVGAPVGEMNATGNLVDLFAHLVEVGNDPWPYSTVVAPTLVFDGVSFSGA
jgi:PmbA protein